MRFDKRRVSDQKALIKRIQKKSQKENTDLDKLSKKAFRCKDDALKAFAQWQKQCELCECIIRSSGSLSQ